MHGHNARHSHFPLLVTNIFIAVQLLQTTGVGVHRANAAQTNDFFMQDGKGFPYPCEDDIKMPDAVNCCGVLYQE